MKTLSKILIVFFLFFKVTYSEQTEKGINIPGGGFIGNYFVYKDLKIDSKKAEAYNYIILDKLPNLEDFYYSFAYYFNLLNDDISVKHTLYTGVEKKEFDYVLGIMDLGNDSNLYYISEIYCDKNGEVKINSGKI